MDSGGHSTTLAVDVAIIPSQAVQRRLAELNAQTHPPPDGFRFGATRVPHLTIAQQFIDHAELRDFIDQLGVLLEEVKPIELTTISVSKPRRASSLGIVLSPPLADLHAQVMDLLRPFAVDGDGHGAFAFFTAGDAPRPADVEWVTEFRGRSAHANFAPHITLGMGPVPNVLPPFTFVADYVGLYHLGRFCTCRMALADWTLTASVT